MNFILEKVLFKDIGNAASGQQDRRVRLAKALALVAICIVFISGTILTAFHAYSYYNGLKEAFFTEPDPIEDLGEFNPSAVWFTHQTGDPHQIRGILAYLDNYENGILTLDIVNVNDIAVELVSVQDKDGKYTHPFPKAESLSPSADYFSQQFTIDDVDERMLAVLSEVLVNYSYDDSVLRQAPLIPFKKFDEDIFDGTTVRVTDNTDAFDFIRDEGEKITFSGQRIEISQPLFIPAGKSLHLSAGQEIDLINGAHIVSRAPIHFEGSAAQPVKVISSDGTGRGLLVMQAVQESLLQHVVFDGLDTLQSGVWGLTGAVTFYESDVHIENTSFINNPSEDGLNIIRSMFTITDSYFANTASDAFDADFCQGSISNSAFENTANDAIDVSGTTIEILDVQTRNNGDKGISAGENSRVELHNISIDQAVVGIASKDLSRVTGESVAIANTRIALTLYIKKAEFGPAQITLDNVTLSGDIDIEHLIQPGSELIIDGRTIRRRSAAKEALLFEKMINGEPIQ